MEYLEIPQHLDLAWSNPDLHHFLERGATYSRAVYFQRRGLGLSDQISYVPTLEQQADDVLAVMDAAGMAKATLVGVFSTCAALALVAAKALERVQGLVFLDPLCGGSQSSGEVGGWSDSERTRYFELLRHAYSNWGSGGIVDIWDPVQATPYNRRLIAMLERCSATPSVAYSHYEWLTQLDVQEVFRSVQVPARVLHIPTNPLPESQVQYAAGLMPTATFHLLPATLPGSSLGEAMISTLDHVEEVATGTIHSADADRYLGTVLFTDVVSSTELLARVGDATYRKLRSDHERLVRLAVETLGGRVMTVSGDGTLSVFDGPTAAVQCAETIRHEAEVAGIAVRAGIHTGELDVTFRTSPA